jgi:hypothetical protein
MHPVQRALAACALVTFAAPTSTAATTPAGVSKAAPGPSRYRFSGEVSRTDSVEKSRPGGLRFVLRPVDNSEPEGPDGWTIEILGPDSTEGFVGVATPPYRGLNPRFIEAWHFRNAENTGPNEGDVNAPQNERDFYFVSNRADYAACHEALERVLWPYAFSDATVDSAQQVLDRLPRGEGRLTIHAMKLGGLRKGSRPWFESMRFDVTLLLPGR